MDFRDLRPDLCRHINRPDQPERIRCRPTAYVDGDMLMVPIPLTQLARIHAVAAHSRHMYGLAWEIEEYTGYHPDLDEPPCTLNDDAWDAYEAEERMSA